MYELLSGRPLFHGNIADVMTKVVAGEFRPLRELNPTLPVDLLATVEAALAKDPKQRLQSAEEFAERLARFVSLDRTWSLAPTSFESGPPFPLAADVRHPLAIAEPVLRDVPRTGTVPPAALVRFDRWSGDRFMTHSLLERPRIPRAPIPPRLDGRVQMLLAATPSAVSPSERAARRATTEHLAVPMAIPMHSRRLHGALVATLFGFGIGLLVALVLGLI